MIITSLAGFQVFIKLNFLPSQSCIIYFHLMGSAMVYVNCGSFQAETQDQQTMAQPVHSNWQNSLTICSLLCWWMSVWCKFHSWVAKLCASLSQVHSWHLCWGSACSDCRVSVYTFWFLTKLHMRTYIILSAKHSQNNEVLEDKMDSHTAHKGQK
jgi:hypothetical protein